MKLHFMKFRVADFYTKTMRLTNEQVGRYIRLLCDEWINGPLQEVDADLEKFFESSPEGWVNKTLEEERKEAIKRYDNATAGAAARWGGNAGADAAAYPGDDANQNQNQNNNKELQSEAELIDGSFDLFWDLYDYKKGKEKARALWKDIKEDEREAIFNYIPAYKLTTPDKEFRKHPATFLRNRSWEDELTITENVKDEYRKYEADKALEELQREAEDESR